MVIYNDVICNNGLTPCFRITRKLIINYMLQNICFVLIHSKWILLYSDTIDRFCNLLNVQSRQIFQTQSSNK